MPMVQLCYVSNTTVPFSEIALEELLINARMKNKALGLSGLLLYRNGIFLQFLEGPDYAVEDLYKTIGADERHNTVQLIMRRNIEVRDFEDWQMGFMRVKPEPDQAGFTDVLEAASLGELGLKENSEKLEHVITSFKTDRWQELVQS